MAEQQVPDPRSQKIILLQWRIRRTRDQIDRCSGCSEQSRALLRKLVALVNQRNQLYTETEQRQFAQERGVM